jgi:hypothetical protein
MYFLVKVLITALVVAGVSELGKRSTALGAVLASLPLTSILAMIWLYRDTQSVEKVSELSTSIFWMVLPSLVFFLALPLILKTGARFGVALAASCLLMFGTYTAYLWVLKRLGIQG